MSRPKEWVTEVQYLNTDLDLESYDDLSPIVAEFGDDVLVLYNGKAKGHYLAVFELQERSDPNGSIEVFCLLAENLSSKARKLWNRCTSRIFDIGFESGEAPSRYWSEIRPSTIRRVSRLGASIAVSIYPIDQER